MLLSMLIKPASSACNMQCKYCFYHDISSKRAVKNYGVMKTSTAENIIKKAFEYTSEGVNFAFQGGEPLLAGKQFYKDFIALVNFHNKNHVNVKYSLQTNGTLVDSEWCEIFEENDFLIGISIDGYAEIHDYFRCDSFSSVTKSVRLLQRQGVKYNVLTVVTKQLAKHCGKVYNEYKKRGFEFLQFIPCLASADCEHDEYSIDAETYGKFLVSMFKIYFQDNKFYKKTNIRLFDNFLSMINGGGIEMCSLNGFCSLQNVIESDGSVYPCDFYCSDVYYLGNINEKTFEDLYNSEVLKKFIDGSDILPSDCKECQYLRLCKNGCKRERKNNKNIFCQSYKTLFPEMLKVMNL